ncbi:fasciclin domain-containing protein [Litoribacter alkaliphilus]|uniref:Fasciclin domain-containing protein n=1 Tax=Litoribacter ruber TaxID=702568 RepID=A0AAP2CIA4_9BACT|nr:fasciclin domain-containing protein [Litoribacter alkaliphilus]MBS9525253.1 fasciclin domain-containing protein [Litoribacter alkaliphilus]
MNKNFKLLGTAFAMMIFGGTAIAQTTPVTNQAMVQEEIEVDYEAIFGDIENTEEHDVLSLLKKDDNFSIFVELIEKSQIDLNAAAEVAGGELTVFAPTNEAFKQLTKEQYTQITEPEDLAVLQNITKSHVLTRIIHSADFRENQVIENADGLEIPVATAGGQGVATPADEVIVGGARIVKPDVKASNGVIHVMDGVVTPEAGGMTSGFGEQ